MNLKKDALENIGELFISGFSGLDLSAETANFLKTSNLGGVLLFSHNYESPAQVSELVTQVQESQKTLPLWISVDHEGGKVQRFKKGFTRIPEAAEISATGSANLAFEIAGVMARELAAVGVNLNFCPVADIHTNPKNPVIGTRSYGTTADDVSKFVSAILRGHLTNGVQPCVKHFPGHGDTTVDSHLALPKITATLETLMNREIRPFIKAFKSRCSMVMTAHILFPEIDSAYPATLSPIFLRKILREELRYSGLIISDDLEMSAITDHYGAEEAPRLALRAGCDLLIYRSEKAVRNAYDSVRTAIEKDELSPEMILTAINRCRKHKQVALKSYQLPQIAELQQKVGTPENLAIVNQVKPSS